MNTIKPQSAGQRAVEETFGFPLSNVIIAEGDSGIARFWCAVCHQSFRGVISRVTCANKQPICIPCIERYNPERQKVGLGPIPYDRAAYEPECDREAL